MVRAARGLRELAAPSAGASRWPRTSGSDGAHGAPARASPSAARRSSTTWFIRAGPPGYRRRLGQAALLSGDGRALPELRDACFHRRFFFSPRSAAFDLAVAGAVLAAARRRPALAVLAAAPYARQLARDSRYWGRRRAPAIAAVRAAGDAVSLGALAIGSVRARHPLLL